jgi:predicted  nucleic acid-binding Zn-ribbon protein
MTLDERIEALVQTVELLAAIHKDNEVKYEGRFDKLTQAVQQNEVRAAQLMDTMNRLGRILEIHDARIDGHEERIDKLEQ